MAAILTAEDDLTRVPVASIEKWEEGPDGTLYVYGRATTPELDTDEQVVSSAWSGSALKAWLDEAPAVRVQHNPSRDPAGSGVKVEVNRDGDGAHWLKAAVDEPGAIRLVKRGHLRAFSVGIAKPVIERDVTGKARGGIITGGRIVEVSLVDSPANRSCFLELAKAAKDGTAEFTGKMIGADGVVTKAAANPADDPDATVTVDIPKTATVTFSPEDLRKLLQHRTVAEQRENEALKVIAAAEAPVYKRDIDTATRRRLAAQGRALANLSYPIETHEDAENAVTLALSGHGDVNAAKSMIRRVARKEGWQDILDRLDGKPARAAKPAKPKKAKSAPGLTASDYVFPESRSFPIVVPADVAATFKAWGEYSGRRTYDDFRRLLCRKAREKGDVFADELPEEWKTKREKQRAAAAAEQGTAYAGDPAAQVIKNGSDDGDEDDGLLHHQDGQDDDPDTEADTMDKAAAAIRELHQAGLDADAVTALLTAEAAKAAAPDVTKPPKITCPACGKKSKAGSRFCPSCGKPLSSEKSAHPVPDNAAGEEGKISPAPEHREPDGPAVEMLERDAHIEDGDEAAELRAAASRKSLGIPYDAAWLHDLLCPAYPPATAKACHPHASLELVDEGAWQKMALDIAANAPLEQAYAATALWSHARTVKALPADLAGELAEQAHKAFRDANPGPGRAPVPGEIPASRYRRPYITEGHAAPSPGHDAPHTAPIHPGHIAASDFQRPFLRAGHAADSPGNPDPRPQPVPAPEVPGVPSRVYYTNVMRDNARQAMTAMHDHIARTFPDVCPMAAPGHMGQPGTGARPVPAGVGGPVAHGPGGPAASKAADGVPEGGDTAPDEAVQRVTRLERKLRRARKAAGIDPEARYIPGEVVTLDAANGFLASSEAIKAAVAEALAAAADTEQERIEAAVTKATAPLLEKMAGQDKKLRKVQKTADAIADQPDPAVTAYRGVALPGIPKASSPPAGEATVAKRAEHAQATVFNAMVDQWRNHEDPNMREAALDVLKEMTGLSTPGAYMRT